MSYVKFREGDWFAVPLPGGGYAVGVIARSNPRAALLGYFFGPRRAEVPSIASATGLTARDAVLVGRFSYLSIRRGEWPLLGQQPGWDRVEWPMPVMIRHEEITGRVLRVYYDDDDPGKRLKDVPVPPGEDTSGPEDGLMGAGFVEERLARLLPPPSP